MTFLSAGPTSAPALTATSTLDLEPGETRENLATVAVGADRTVRIYNNAGSVDAFADLVGYYTADSSGDEFFAVAPTRILDTRDGTRAHDGARALSPAASRTTSRLPAPSRRRTDRSVSLVAPLPY